MRHQLANVARARIVAVHGDSALLRAAVTDEAGCNLVRHPHADPPNRPLKHENPLARGGFRIAGAGFEPATFGL